MREDDRPCAFRLYIDYLSSIECFLQCGDTAEVPLVDAKAPPEELHDRWKVVQKMEMTTQYSFAGDYTGKSHSSSNTRLLSRFGDSGGHREGCD